MNTSGIGLALGGGGAKGLAHVGVLRVLKRESIPIDFIAGTSVGALMGSLFALDRTTDRIEHVLADLNTRKLLSLYSIGWRQKGFVGGGKFERFLDQLTGSATVESCAIPFAAVATDINTGNAVRLREGSLSLAIRASSAIPLLFAPVEHDGMTLVDGGLSETIPVETARAMGATKIIAVNLEGSYFSEIRTVGASLRTLANNSYAILKSHLSKLQANEADVAITPQVGDPSLLQFAGGEALVAAGEEAATAALGTLRRLVS